MEENTLNIVEEEIKQPKKEKRLSGKRKWLILLIIGLVSLVGGVACLLIAFLGFAKETQEFQTDADSAGQDEQKYSALTGELLTDKSLFNAPTFCVQTPNGTDGARPQAGLNEAGVVFEAVAEAGITRFAAIYQDPTTAIIGPIRSLRMYYLDWDTPFDCTVVHAGGAYDALTALTNYGHRDLTEDYTYMYRGTYGSRLWNNLFTTSDYLKQFNQSHGYDKSEIKGFLRMTPTESSKARFDTSAVHPLNITQPAAGDTSETVVDTPFVSLIFGGLSNFNVSYQYDNETNTYLRSYQNGTPHEVYACAQEDLGERNPEDVCNLVQLAPSVVIAMTVEQRKAADNYHEDITTIGSGKAYVFQNGTVIEGTWKKDSRDSQIKFFDSEDREIGLAPGQTFISAIPAYGGVEF